MYFTTSLLPSGNHLVADSVCPGLMPMPTTPHRLRLLQEVDIQRTADVLQLNTSLGSEELRWDVNWIVGEPGSQFWMVLESGDLYRLSYHGNNTNYLTDKEDPLDKTSKSVVHWGATDNAERPLIIAKARDPYTDSNETSSIFQPLQSPPSSPTSPLSSPVPTPNGGLLFVDFDPATDSYQLTQVTQNNTDVTHASLRAPPIKDPLPDATLAYSHQHQMWAVYTSSTTRYDHAVLGDSLEADALTLLKWNADTHQVEYYTQTTLLSADDESVFEGLGVIWADVNGDGRDDIITTISNQNVGARLRVYTIINTNDSEDPQLSLLAQAPAIGLGGRWLHQLAVGSLGPQGEVEIVEIRTPHIGGIVRYYRWQQGSDELQLVASKSPYTSHNIRSRNLDKAVVGDFNGDGIPELVVQTQAKTMLVGLQRTATDSNNDDNGEGGVETVWSIPLRSPVASNLAVSCSHENEITGEEEDGNSIIMEIMFATENQELVKLQFAPSNFNVDEDIGDVEFMHRSGDSSSSSSCDTSFWTNRQSLEHIRVLSLLFWGLSITVILQKATDAF